MQAIQAERIVVTVLFVRSGVMNAIFGMKLKEIDNWIVARKIQHCRIFYQRLITVIVNWFCVPLA